MSSSLSGIPRPIFYAGAAAMLGFVVGYLREGAIGGALALAFAIGLGVTIGILALEAWQRYG